MLQSRMWGGGGGADYVVHRHSVSNQNVLAKLNLLKNVPLWFGIGATYSLTPGLVWEGVCIVPELMFN